MVILEQDASSPETGFVGIHKRSILKVVKQNVCHRELHREHVDQKFAWKFVVTRKLLKRRQCHAFFE